MRLPCEPQPVGEPAAATVFAARGMMREPSTARTEPPLDLPQTQYAEVGNDRVAWQTLGEGPQDLVIASGIWSHLDLLWEEPATAAAYRRLASYCRLIRYDRRGNGLSDPRPAGGSMIEHWIDDLLAVLDAAGARAPIILAIGDTGPLLLKFYARHPQRCSGLIFLNTSAGLAAAEGYPEGHPADVMATVAERIRKRWGREEVDPDVTAGAQTAASLRLLARLQRAMASPKAVQDNLETIGSIDSREVLPQVTVPTLVVTRSELTIFTAAQARYLARQIPGARYEELPGNPRMAWDDSERLQQLIEEFVTGERPPQAAQRMLATVLMTDIVDSTRQLAKLGDAAWRALLDQHDALVRGGIERRGGRLVDQAGDGTLAVFPSPSAAIDCAQALIETLDALNIRIRAGLHIGEIELRDEGRVGGMAVHIGARVLGRAEDGEVLVSRTVRDVLIGSHHVFAERGIHTLKGVPSKWPLYAVRAPKRA